MHFYKNISPNSFKKENMSEEPNNENLNKNFILNKSFHKFEPFMR